MTPTAPSSAPRLAVASTSDRATETGLAAVLAEVGAELGAPADLVLVYAAAGHDPDRLLAGIRAWAPKAAVAGASSCLGVMTPAGFSAPHGIGVLALCDPAGDVGVGACALGADPETAGRSAVRDAVRRAGRPGQVPDLIWVCGAPGSEEAVLRGIESVVGQVPVLGGSSADDTVQGDWWQLHTDGADTASVTVVALFSSAVLGWSFHSGYTPTNKVATVTAAEGRVLAALDGVPAAQLYNAWTDGALGEAARGGGAVLSQTTWHPFGREVGAVGGVPYHALLHPERVTMDGGLQLFAEVAVGEQLTLMTGDRPTMVARAGRVARYAIESVEQNGGHEILGALVVFCAGCMLAVRDEMDAVIAGLQSELGEVPFIGTFTFGEQGCLLGGENRHGNLMISVVTLHAR